MNISNLTMIFAEGFVFIGKLLDSVLKDAVRVDTVNLMSSDELMPVTVLNKIGDLEINISKYPSAKVSTQSPLYKDYVKLTTGIEIANNKISH